MEKDINKIQIGKTRGTLTTPKWIAKWNVQNRPEQSAAPPQTNDGTIHYQNIDEWLRPEIEFTRNFASAEEYAEAENILLLGAFVCRFYNPAIQKWFTGLFRLTDSSVALFLRTAGNRYAGVVDYAFKAKSVFTYDSLAHMAEKAENDDRF